MKRFFPFILSLLLLCLCPTAFAANTYQTAGDLFQVWAEADEFPDYLTAVWSTDGGSENLTFGLVEGEAGEAGKAEILSLVENPSTVSFVTQKYPRNALAQIMNELEPYFKSGLGICSAGLNEYENRVDISINDTRQDDPETQAMVQELNEKYGDAILCTYSDAQIVLTDAAPVEMVAITGSLKESLPYLPALICTCVVILLFALLTLRPQHLFLNRTHGTTGTSSDLSSAQIAQMVKDAAPTLSADADERILNALDAQK